MALLLRRSFFDIGASRLPRFAARGRSTAGAVARTHKRTPRSHTFSLRVQKRESLFSSLGEGGRERERERIWKTELRTWVLEFCWISGSALRSQEWVTKEIRRELQLLVYHHQHQHMVVTQEMGSTMVLIRIQVSTPILVVTHNLEMVITRNLELQWLENRPTLASILIISRQPRLRILVVVMRASWRKRRLSQQLGTIMDNNSSSSSSSSHRRVTLLLLLSNRRIPLLVPMCRHQHFLVALELVRK